MKISVWNRLDFQNQASVWPNQSMIDCIICPWDIILKISAHKLWMVLSDIMILMPVRARRSALFTRKSARFCVVCALNCAQILVVRALDCANFFCTLPFSQLSWNTDYKALGRLLYFQFCKLNDNACPTYTSCVQLGTLLLI